MVEAILDRLNGEYWRGREGSVGLSPVSAAKLQLSGDFPNWRMALQTLQDNYDPVTARDAWIALLSEPNSGFSTYDPITDRWVLYCVPGYQSCDMPTTAAGQAVPSPPMSTSSKVLLAFATAGFLWFVYMTRPETEEEKRYYRRTYAR